jgi:hypothetical protein
MLNLDSTPKRLESLLAPSDTEGGTVLLNLDDGQYYALDEVGSRVWGLADGKRTIRQISEAVCEEYDAPLDEVTRDVIDLLQQLAEENLVTTA